VIDAPGDADDGLIARDAEGRPLVATKSGIVPAGPTVQPAFKGRFTLPDGRSAVPVLELLARRYTNPDYAPDAVAETCGIPASTIRRIAAELASAAFDHPVVLNQPWIDAWGQRHEQMIGRPVAMHAMRGISAHSNGFHTCRAIHLLQILLGTIDTPGGFRFKTPFPRPIPPGPQPAGRPDQIAPDMPMAGPPLGFPRGPEDLILEDDGSPRRIDKAFSWDAPLALHGMMHSVIGNAFRGDPYAVDVLFMYMANMAWNSAMNSTETAAMLTAKKPDGSYVIPKIIYSDAFYSETVAYADLILPDTTYLERWDCISLFDRPIGSADAVADSIRRPVVAADRDVRPFQDVLIELGARLGLPAFRNNDGSPRFPGGYADYMVNHERKPGVGPLAGWRGETGERHGVGTPNPGQLDRYIANGCFFSHPIPAEARYFKHVNAAYLAFAKEMGLIDAANPIILQLYSEPLQRFRLAAQGHGKTQPPENKRWRIKENFDPLPIWYPPFDEAVVDSEAFPLHAVTQRPMFMYHSWGGHNPWLRQILSRNALYMHHATAAALGIADGDRVAITSRHGRVVGRAKLMAGVHPSTVWTWNAIGKRKGAWGLDGDIPEATESFLLNPLIDDLLPARDGGYRYANADPVTGQAAWYDLRVKVEKLPRDHRQDLPPAIRRQPNGQKVPATLAYAVKPGR
jgi:sulfite dehydrogenase (quinone) subunit SoeA